MKLFAIVITYNPDIRCLIDNIKKFINHVDSILVWDNGNSLVGEDAERIMSILPPPITS